jgi:hypothetical protein
MEHRWGERISVDLPVQLRSTVGFIAAGRIANVSASGALIRTELRLAPLNRIDILIDGLPVPAFVVRTPSGAIGVEWCEFAPGIVTAVLLAQTQSIPQPLAPAKPDPAPEHRTAVSA